MSRSALILIFSLLLPAHTTFARNLNWSYDFDQAVQQSKESSRPIFLNFFADWCGWCHQLHKEVFTDPSFIQFSQSFVLLEADVEDQGKGSRMAKQFHVESLPVLVILDPDGQIVDRIDSFMPAKDLISEIQTMQKLVAKEKLNVQDWETRQELGEEFLYRDLNAEAEIRFSNILTIPGVPDREKESCYFSLALAQYYQGKLHQPLATLNRYLETYSDGNSVEDVLLLLSQIYIELEEPDKARTILEQFIKKFPESENVNRAKEVLAHLDAR